MAIYIQSENVLASSASSLGHARQMWERKNDDDKKLAMSRESNG
jgi:hypothetical protein